MTVRAAERNRTTRDAPGGLRVAPVTRSGLLVWAGAYVVLTVAAVVVGWLIVDHLDAVRRLDDRISRHLGTMRTETWNSLTWFGSGIAEAVVKIPATIVLSAFFLWRWRRWREVALLVGALLLEVAVFVTASFIVDRARPPIPQLDSIPPTSAYPSGHTAAAVAFYGAIAIIVFWHTRNRVARGVALAAAILLPPVVGFSRTYRGMHHLSDVVVGGVLGIVSLAVTYRVVTTGPDPERGSRGRLRGRRRVDQDDGSIPVHRAAGNLSGGHSDDSVLSTVGADDPGRADEDRSRHLRHPLDPARTRAAAVRVPELDGDPRRAADDRRHGHDRES